MAKKKKTLPRGVEQLRTGKYRARIFFQGKQHNLGHFTTISDAKAALAIAQSEKARGVFVAPAIRRERERILQERAAVEAARAEHTVTDLGNTWLAWLERMGRSTGTIYTYQRHLEAYFYPTFGGRSVTSITTGEINDWYDNLLATKGTGVAPKVYITVAAMFKYATGETKDLPRAYEKWLDESPVDIPGAGRSEPKTRASDEPVATVDEIAQIAAHMPAREALGVLLAGWCALRIGEVLALRRRHIKRTGQGENRVVWVSVEQQVQARGSGPRLDPPKSAAGVRQVPVPKKLVPELEAHLKKYVDKDAEALLFPRDTTGNQVHNPNTFRKHFNSARDRVIAAGDQQTARLKNFTFHGLRHSCLTRLGRAGATLADLMAYAGHSDVESVLVYQHSERERLASLAETMAAEL